MTSPKCINGLESMKSLRMDIVSVKEAYALVRTAGHKLKHKNIKTLRSSDACVTIVSSEDMLA